MSARREQPAGAAPVRTTPLPPWPHHDADEIEAATATLRTGRVNYWTGPEGRAFESEFAAFCGVRHGVALANGTVALELALQALDIGPGDEVVVTPRTFIASVSSVAMRGAVPVFADVERDSQNLDPQAVRRVIGPRTRCILPVHLAGWPCDMDAIMAIAREHGLRVIEDCSQAHGASFRGRPVGAFGDLATFSFCQDKIMSTGGEGGLVVTDDAALWERVWSAKDHGKRYAATAGGGPANASRAFRWVHDGFGTNGRLTEFQAAIGRRQLAKLPQWRALRQRNASILADFCAGIGALRVPMPPPHVDHAWYKFYAFVRPERLRSGWDRDRVIEAINAEGVPCFSGSCPEVYREAAFADAGLQPPARLPVARELGETSLMFLVHPTLSEADMDDACRAIRRVFERAAGE